MVVIVGDGYGWTMGLNRLNIFCALPGRSMTCGSAEYHPGTRNSMRGKLKFRNRG